MESQEFNEMPPIGLPQGNFEMMFNREPETQNFKLSEFKCHDGTAVPKAYWGNVQYLMYQLQALRDAVGRPVHINSGYRTPAYNARIGGAPGSMHKVAKAADIVIKGMTPQQVRAKIKALISSGDMEDGGIGSYDSFTHYDVGRPRRW